MADLRKLKIDVKPKVRPLHPAEIFSALTLRGKVNNIWGPQVEALDDWHKNHRDKDDVVLCMNTGGGKTLVGILMAQSMVHEGRGSVVYVCATNQLVEQTKAIANDCGLFPAVRYRREWQERENYDQGDTFCITNYATMFNGWSVFKDEKFEAAIFDDAHVAEHTIRDLFTVKISNTSDAYKKVINIFRSEFSSDATLAARCQDVEQGLTNDILYVPMHISIQFKDSLRKVLNDTGLADEKSNQYSWEHIREKLGMCTVIISHQKIEIAPIVTPTRALTQFAACRRKLYLTATMPTQVGFIRTFGNRQPVSIEPPGKSGEAQKLFLFAAGDDDNSQRLAAQEIIEQHKACIILPSNWHMKNWETIAQRFGTESGQNSIDEFCDAKDNRKMALVGRYDGVDIPGDSCRILVLDGLPVGEHHIDRFVDESLRIGTLRTSHTAIRIAQAVGRIFRSNTDHGVVILVGGQVQSWLRNPQNRQYLSPLLQKQLAVSIALDEHVRSGAVSHAELISKVMIGEADWDETYRDGIADATAEYRSLDIDWYVELAAQEYEAQVKLWSAQCGEATVIYNELVEAATTHDERLAAWYWHWKGVSQELDGKRDDALISYVIAGNRRSELGRPKDKPRKTGVSTTHQVPNFQAKRIADSYSKNRSKFLRDIQSVQEGLRYGNDCINLAEEAVKTLGELLGLRSRRPEKDSGSGPDVLWLGEGDLRGAFFELKTGKVNNVYSKSEIMESEDHERWVEEHIGAGSYLKHIVGKHLEVSNKANPSSELLVVELEEFQELLKLLKSVVEAVDVASDSSYENKFQRWLEHYGLVWPACVDARSSRLAIDLERVRD